MSAVNSIRTMLQRFGFSEAEATYLTGTCGIDSLDEIAYLDGIEDVDTTIKGVTNMGGTVTTGEGKELPGLLRVTMGFLSPSGKWITSSSASTT
jgi:hypothetical protein